MARGRAHTPTEETRSVVQAMTAAGIAQVSIARYFKMTDTTLRKHYRDELELGGEKAVALVAQSLFNKAVSPTHPAATTAAIFWLKANPHARKAGWSEQQTIAHEGSDGPPIKTEEQNPIAALPKDTLLAIRELILKGRPAIAAPSD